LHGLPTDQQAVSSDGYKSAQVAPPRSQPRVALGPTDKSTLSSLGQVAPFTDTYGEKNYEYNEQQTPIPMTHGFYLDPDLIRHSTGTHYVSRDDVDQQLLSPTYDQEHDVALRTFHMYSGDDDQPVDTPERQSATIDLPNIPILSGSDEDTTEDEETRAAKVLHMSQRLSRRLSKCVGGKYQVNQVM